MHILKHQRFTPSGCNDIGTRKSATLSCKDIGMRESGLPTSAMAVDSFRLLPPE